MIMTVTDERLREACGRVGLKAGSAAGYPSPGWQWLRGLVDHVAVALAGERFETLETDVVEEFFRDQSGLRSALLRPNDALLAVADLGVVEAGADAAEFCASSMHMRTKFIEVVYDLLDWAGFVVCRAVFAPSGDGAER